MIPTPVQTLRQNAESCSSCVDISFPEIQCSAHSPDAMTNCRYLQALRNQKKRVKEEAKERREMGIERDKDAGKKALEQQRLIIEGRTDEFYKVASPPRA